MIGKYEEVTGVILAGGKSSRMGQDKGLIVVGGRSFTERAIALLQPRCREVIISGNHEAYDRFGLKRITDHISEVGPLGGIISCLLIYPRIFVLSCDMPLLDSRVPDLLLKEPEGEWDAIIPLHNGEPEPLCAIYNRSALPAMQEAVRSNNFRMKDVLRQLKVKQIELPTRIFESSFRNVNTPEELQTIQGLIP